MHLESCQSGGYSPDFGTSLYGMETDFTVTEMSENIKSFISSRQPSPELDISSINSSLGQTYVRETTPDRDLGHFPDLFFREGSPVEEAIGGHHGILVSTSKGEPMLSEASPMPFSPPAISVDVAEDYQCDSSIMSSSNAITEALGDLNANFGFTDDEWHTSLDSLLTGIPATTHLPELVVTNQREEEIALKKAESQTSVAVRTRLPQDRLLGLPGTNSYDSCMETPASGAEPPLPCTSSPMSVSPGGSSIPSPMTSLRSSFNHGRRYKRPHSISPSNHDNLDLNTIIRLSPNCLMSSRRPNTAHTSNATSLSGSPGGSYGHYLPRPETNNNNIQRNNLNFTSLLADEDMKVDSSSASTSMVTLASHSDPMLFKMEASEISHNVVGSTTPYTASPYLSSLVSPITHRTIESQITSSNCSPLQSPLGVTQVTCLASSNDASYQILSNSCSYSIVSSTTRDQHPSIQSSSSSFPFNYPTSEDTTLKSPVSETQRGHLTQIHHHRTPSLDGTTPHYPDEDHSPYLEDDVSGDGEVSDESSEPRVCRWVDCNAVFQDKASLSRHIERAHVDQRKGDDYTCFWSACQRKYRAFNARYKLLIHMRVHSGEKPNKCSFPGCDKAFSRLENLKIHLRSHTGERPYVCVHSHCSKAFSNSSDRAKHQRTHLDAKPYVCCVPGCQKRYTDPSSLRKHIKNHNARDQLLAKRKLQCRSSEGASRGPLMAPLPPLLSMHSHSASERGGRGGVGGSPGGDCGGAEAGDVVRFSLRCHVLSRRPREVMHDSLGLPELTLATQEDLDLWIS